MDARHHQRAPAIQGLEGRGHQLAGGGEQDGGVEGDGGRVAGPAGRGRPQVQGEALRRRRPGEHVDLGSPVERHLGGEVGRSAEPVDPESPTRWQVGEGQGAVADDAGAQQGCGRHVVEPVGEGVDEGLGCGDELGVTAVGVPTGEAGIGAQVLPAAGAEPAGATGAAQPGHPHAGTGRDPARAGAVADHRSHHLVARHRAGPVGDQVALGQVQVGAAHPAGVHPDQDLTRPRLRIGPLAEHQRPRGHRPGLFHAPCSHRSPPDGVGEGVGTGAGRRSRASVQGVDQVGSRASR